MVFKRIGFKNLLDGFRTLNSYAGDLSFQSTFEYKTNC